MKILSPVLHFPSVHPFFLPVHPKLNCTVSTLCYECDLNSIHSSLPLSPTVAPSLNISPLNSHLCTTVFNSLPTYIIKKRAFFLLYLSFVSVPIYFAYAWWSRKENPSFSLHLHARMHAHTHTQISSLSLALQIKILSPISMYVMDFLCLLFKQIKFHCKLECWYKVCWIVYRTQRTWGIYYWRLRKLITLLTVGWHIWNSWNFSNSTVNIVEMKDMQTCQLGENHVACNTGGRNATCIHNVSQEI